MDWGDAHLPVCAGTTPLAGPAIVIHGGAWAIPDDEIEVHLEGLHRALARGQQLLERGETAFHVVAAVVAVLESHPAFDAGLGAVLDRDGRPQLDAGIMDGQSMEWGAVANVRTVANPVQLAARLARSDGQARLMVGEGAERLAAELGLPHIDPQRLIVEREWSRFESLRAGDHFHTSTAFSGASGGREPHESPRGTVGCVALDARGHLAAATSTGGAPYTRPGRVGDSPIVGSGFWADRNAALSATGWGEAISTVQLCARTADDIARGSSPIDASTERLAQMRESIRWPGASPATGGLIALDASGVGGWAFTTPRMARGGWTKSGGAWAAVERV